MKTVKVTEHDIQASFFNWVDNMALFDWRYKNIFAVPNARVSHHRYYSNEGMRSGVPDVFVAYPSENHPGLFIEFKSAKGRLSTNQADWIERLKKAGYPCFVINNWEEAVRIVRKYLGANTRKGSKPTSKASQPNPSGGIHED